MHESSLAKTLLRQAERIGREQGGGRLLELCVEIGPLAGIEASLLESAFDRLVGAEGRTLPRLIVETTPLVVRCRDCAVESELTDFVFLCPACRSGAVQVVQGDQMQLVSIKVADDL